MTSEMGLRERKKLATRAALSQAAWSLMVEHGLDAVTPEAIAEAVDVSPRTFRNYFTSREEAILDELVRRAASVTEAIRARPASEPVWDSLEHVLPTVVAGLVGGRRDIVVLMSAIKCDPAMQAQHLVTFERGHQLLVEAMAERTGTDAERDLAPRLLAAATAVVLRTSMEMWADGKTDATLPDLIQESLAQLRAGLPLGTTSPTG
ncbi:MAG TPA: TetR/AcrR family transcriptional regulator [Mycobacteriales bacterium]|nr:TetR/AcrR family transcriptional regulator [Mycobacteriales bacterium]